MKGKCKTAAFGLALVAAFAGVVSCRTANPLPPADLSTPGWHVLQGQVLWKPGRNRSEVAANLLLATNTAGDFFLQLTKDPFPLATAEVLGNQWQIQFDGGKSHGRGEPPARFSLFQLSRALCGGRLALDWRFEIGSANRWRLDNLRTGESLEGGFFP